MRHPFRNGSKLKLKSLLNDKKAQVYVSHPHFKNWLRLNVALLSQRTKRASAYAHLNAP